MKKNLEFLRVADVLNTKVLGAIRSLFCAKDKTGTVFVSTDLKQWISKNVTPRAEVAAPATVRYATVVEAGGLEGTSALDTFRPAEGLSLIASLVLGGSDVLVEGRKHFFRLGGEGGPITVVVKTGESCYDFDIWYACLSLDEDAVEANDRIFLPP